MSVYVVSAENVNSFKSLLDRVKYEMFLLLVGWNPGYYRTDPSDVNICRYGWWAVVIPKSTLRFDVRPIKVRDKATTDDYIEETSG